MTKNTATPIQKIIEVKGEDLLQGISSKNTSAYGGMFQELLGIDVFDAVGFAQPSLAETKVTTNLATVPKVLTTWDGTTAGDNTAYVYGHSATKLYQVLRNSPYTVTDETAQITTHTDLLGAIIWKGKYIYIANVSGVKVYANALPVASGSDLNINAGFLQSTLVDTVPTCIGADGNLYLGNYQQVNKLTSVAGTTGNSGTFSIDLGFTVRDITNDGRYLVIIADNNAIASANRLVGDYKCRIYFWDMSRGTADIIYELHGESYMIAGKFLDGAVYLLGYSGFYVCNAATPPTMIRSFLGVNTRAVGRPANSYQVTAGRGSIYWINGTISASLNGIIYAYGNPIAGQPKVFYEPYINAGPNNINTDKQQAILLSGTNIWNAETGTPALYVNNSAATYSNTTITTIEYQLPQPHRFAYAKVTLAAPLASGQTVTMQIVTDGGSTQVSLPATQSYNASASHRQLIFEPSPNSGTPNVMDSFYVKLTLVGNVQVARLAVYGTPIEDYYHER